MIDDPAIRSQIAELRLLSGLGRDLAVKMVDILASISKEESALTNTVLFTTGDPYSDDGYILIEGEISVLKEGFPEVVASAPELIGETARLSSARQRTATVTAATDLKLLHFEWSEFTRAAQTYLTDPELEKVSSAIQEYAWAHFTQ